MDSDVVLKIKDAQLNLGLLECVMKKASIDYANDIIEDSVNHQDAVQASAEDFVAGSLWMLENLSRFIKK